MASPSWLKAELPKEGQQPPASASAKDDNDSCHHNHRQTIMTIKDNDHGDKDDKKDDETDIPNDNPSDHLRTKNPKNSPEISHGSRASVIRAPCHP